mgnify:CR=1 FL=1
MTTVNSREYGKALSTYGFNYQNIIRYRRDSGIDKVSKRQVDWYMNNLLKRLDISMVWACVEPDYDKYTGQTYSSNHVHFAYVGNKSLSNDVVFGSIFLERAINDNMTIGVDFIPFEAEFKFLFESDRCSCILRRCARKVLNISCNC